MQLREWVEFGVGKGEVVVVIEIASCVCVKGKGNEGKSGREVEFGYR